MAHARTPFPCGECGYDLTGLDVPRCPECGRTFVPRHEYRRRRLLSAMLKTPVTATRPPSIWWGLGQMLLAPGVWLLWLLFVRVIEANQLSSKLMALNVGLFLLVLPGAMYIAYLTSLALARRTLFSRAIHDNWRVERYRIGRRLTRLVACLFAVQYILAALLASWLG